MSRHLRHRHSRAWWRRYRARLRRKRAMLRQARDFAVRRGEDLSNPSAAAGSKVEWSRSAATAVGGQFNDPRGISMTMPNGWSARAFVAEGETRFRVFAADGRPAGEAALTVVSPASSTAVLLPGRIQRRMFGAVSFSELRRLIINKMVEANGWVVNDAEREIGGRRFFIVFAQTAPSDNGHTPQQSWIIYFTELDGRIYSFAAHAPLEFADRIAAESENVMASLRLRNSSALAESSPR